MGFGEHTQEIGGVKVEPFSLDSPPPTLDGKGWRITIDWDAYEEGQKFTDVFAQLLATDGVESLEAFVIGMWDGAGEGQDNSEILEALVSARDQMPNLRYLFIGDILLEECEVSWIEQSDISPVFLAFPKLKELRVRGTNGLSLGRPSHANLERLVVQGGGLPGALVREIATADLPKLSHLELWFGDANYGRSVVQDDLQPILAGAVFPQLRYLGLRNDAEADEMVAWLDGADVLKTLNALDLSLGTLSDAGVDILINNEDIKRLNKLDLHHHFISPEVADRLQRAFQTVDIDVSDRQEESRYGSDVYRYNFVSE